MESRIKDLPNFVKDSKSKAVILKREKGICDIKIDNLVIEIEKLKERVKILEDKLNN